MTTSLCELFFRPEMEGEEMQHRIRKQGPLLDEYGILREPGWDTRLSLAYRRKDVKAGPLRIKEWDYYLITNGRYGLALTVADNSYMGLDSVSLLDFGKGWEHTNSPMRILPMGRTRLPETSERGNVFVRQKKYVMLFENDGTERRLTFHMDDFHRGRPIDGSVTLRDPPRDSMVIATPFAGAPKAFYYNQKINCLRAEGYVNYGGREFRFDPADSFGVLDWGRGVWTYDNTWYWASASGLIDGVPFGFNLGYGFGNTDAASENMLIYDGAAHKLSRVTFLIPRSGGSDDYMNPWRITSDDGRFEAVFHPVLDRASNTRIGPLGSDQHQVFGVFTGAVTLDSGRVLHLDRFFGFAEKVWNQW